MIKTLIYIDVFLIMVSLASGLYFLIVDQGKTDSKRTVYSLGFRVTLAVILVISKSSPALANVVEPALVQTISHAPTLLEMNLMEN